MISRLTLPRFIALAFMAALCWPTLVSSVERRVAAPGWLPESFRRPAGGDRASARARQAARAWPLWIGILSIVLIAEMVIALGNPALGGGLHLALLFVLPIQAGLGSPRYQPLLLSLTIAPLVRLVSLAMPLTGLPMELWWVLTSAPLFIAAIPLVRLLGLTRDQLALRIGHLPTQLAIALVGLPLALGEYLILHPTGVASELSPTEALAPALALLVSTGFLEELLFRGLLQVVAHELLGAWGLVYVAAVFAVLHVGYLSAIDVVFVFAVGLLFAWLVARTRSLLGVTLAHGITNTGLYVVLPHLLPGISLASLFGW